jgi:hypothetical protein
MKYFLAFFLFLLVLLVIGLLAVGYLLRKGFKFLTRLSSGNISDEEFQRMSDKYYSSKKRDNVQFDDDYFKGTTNQGSSQRQNQSQTYRQRTTRTADGITITDNRDPEAANKKIFNHDEGEYVEFTEQ